MDLRISQEVDDLAGDQQAVRKIIKARLQQIGAGLNEFASEVSFHQDAGLLGRELRLSLRQDLDRILAQVGLLSFSLGRTSGGTPPGDKEPGP